jgi:hypothetical protein
MSRTSSQSRLKQQFAVPSTPGRDITITSTAAGAPRNDQQHRMKGDWKELRTDDGRLYYLNVLTARTTWNAEETSFATLAWATPQPAQPAPTPPPTVQTKLVLDSPKPEEMPSSPPPSRPVVAAPPPPPPKKLQPPPPLMTMVSPTDLPSTSFVTDGVSSPPQPMTSPLEVATQATKPVASTMPNKPTNLSPPPAIVTKSPPPQPPTPSPTVPPISQAVSMPAAGEIRGEWKAAAQSGSNKIYFINTKTKETTWDIKKTSFATGDAASPATPATPTVATSTTTQPAPKSGEIRGDWKAMQQDGTGKMYFIHIKTKETTWDVKKTSFGTAPVPNAATPTAATPGATTAVAQGPAPGDVCGDWKAAKHEATGKIYFINTKTKETTWDVKKTPFGDLPPAPSSIAAVATKTSVPTAPKPGDIRGDWKAAEHPSTGKLYFINTKTKTTTWNVKETSFAE